MICKFREKQISSSSHREKDLLQSNVRQLVYEKSIERIEIHICFLCREVNKGLRDENDALRAAIDSNKSAISPSEVRHSMNSFKRNSLFILAYSYIKTIDVSSRIYP